MSSKSSTPPQPQWVKDLISPPAPRTTPNWPTPPGYRDSAPHSSLKQRSKASTRKAPTQEEMDTLKMKKAWELAIAPAKQLPMNAFGMYMTGNSLQIFSIFMVFTLFKTPITAILSIPRAFAPYETPGTSSRLLVVKLVYVLTNLMMLALGIWKVNGMGLLPTTRSDWLAWEGERTWSERAVPREWL